MGRFAELSAAYVAKTLKERGWTYMGALYAAQTIGPDLLGRNPQCLSSTYPR